MTRASEILQKNITWFNFDLSLLIQIIASGYLIASFKLLKTWRLNRQQKTTRATANEIATNDPEQN
jgi:hypothetical protein